METSALNLELELELGIHIWNWIRKSNFVPFFVLVSESTCGETFSDTTGEILSPSYPADYPDLQECVYLVRVLGALDITFYVNDLEIETTPGSSDKVIIGPGSTVDVNGEGTVQSSGDAFTVSSDQAWIYFTSDRDTSFRGFNITYDAGT